MRAHVFECVTGRERERACVCVCVCCVHALVPQCVIWGWHVFVERRRNKIQEPVMMRRSDIPFLLALNTPHELGMCVVE